MIIKASNIKGETVKDVIDELYAMPEVMEFVRGYNLPTFDVIEAMATKIVSDDADINTDDYRIDNKIKCEFCGKIIEDNKETRTKQDHLFCSYECLQGFYGDEIPENEDFLSAKA